MKSIRPPEETDIVAVLPDSRTCLVTGLNGFLFAGCLALLAGVCLFLASEAHGTAKEGFKSMGQPPPLVTVMKVTEKDVNQPEEFVRRLEAIQSVDLRAQVSGYLEKVGFREGECVTEGEVLYQIEKDPYEAKVNADQAKVDQCQATLTLARQYLKRLRSVDAGGVSVSDIETAESETARSRGSLQEARATLEESKINLAYTTIKAPITGRIGKNAYTRGNLVGTDSGTLARIVQVHPIRVVFSISENELPEIQKNYVSSDDDPLHKPHIIRIRLPNGTIHPGSGRLDFVDNEVDPDTGTIAIRARFDNPDGILLPGQYVTVLVRNAQPRNMPVVSQAAAGSIGTARPARINRSSIH